MPSDQHISARRTRPVPVAGFDLKRQFDAGRVLCPTLPLQPVVLELPEWLSLPEVAILKLFVDVALQGLAPPSMLATSAPCSRSTCPACALPYCTAVCQGVMRLASLQTTMSVPLASSAPIASVCLILTG